MSITNNRTLPPYNISNWACRNRKTAILLILFGDLFLAFLGMCIGICLFSLGLEYSKLSISLIVWGSLTVIYLYPRKNEGVGNAQYSLKRICHALTYFAAFLLFTAAGNKVPQIIQNYEQNEQAVPLYMSLKKKQKGRAIKYANIYSAQPKLFMDEVIPNAGRREWQNKLRVAVYELEAHNEDLPKDFVAFLLLLGGITAAGLSCLLAVLSNRASCSGKQLAAGSLAVLATGGLVGAVVPVVMTIIKLAGP